MSSLDLFFRIFSAQRADDVRADIESLDAAGWSDVLRLAQRHQCTPLLKQRLQVWGSLHLLPLASQQSLTAIARNNAAANLQRFHALSELVAELGPSTPLMALKGGALARTHYADISLRTMVDLDLLARPEHLPAVTQTFQRLGYRQDAAEVFHYDEQDEGRHHHEPAYVKGGVNFELHRSILESGTPFTVDLSGLWQRTQPSATPGLLYPSLEDQLLHLCLHAIYSHRTIIGLYAFVDIQLVCEDPALNLQQVIALAKQWRAERCVFLGLKMAERLVAARVPTELMLALQPADYGPAVLERALMTQRYGLQSGPEISGPWVRTVAALTSAKTWTRLPSTLRRRLLTRSEHRVKWSEVENTHWYSQIQPLLSGLIRTLHSREQRRVTAAWINGHRLNRWLERSV